jgi:hypothetical protein
MEKILQIRMNGMAVAVPFILSFKTEKDFTDKCDLATHLEATLRKDLLKAIYKEAKKKYGTGLSDGNTGAEDGAKD